MDNINGAKDFLENNGVILHLTDTIWGLAANINSKTAIERIAQLKQRPLEKSFIVLFANKTVAKRYMPEALAHTLATNPFTTYISKEIKEIPLHLYAQDGTLGVRIPQFTQLQELLTSLQLPIVSTSANISGQPNPTNFNDVANSIVNAVDFVLHSEDHTGQRKSSKIIKIDSTGNKTVLRP